MNQSIATINAPEFINLEPLEINPLMSKCEIKVLYLGKNRNQSFISKEVAIEMSKTLRGAPIVGYYSEEKEDFRDHGEQLILDGDGFKFNCLTKPYGFVSPDAEVWFQKFEDVDDFGNTNEREYLMTTGYLWTGQFEELESVLAEGRPQSMELDEKSLDGHWSKDTKENVEFFIINDAIFSKLCILGEDVEPCFEGADVSAVSTTTQYALDDNFRRTLSSMMQDLKNYVNRKGEQQMKDNKTQETATVLEEDVEETVFANEGAEKPAAGATDAVAEEPVGDTPETTSTNESEDVDTDFSEGDSPAAEIEESTEVSDGEEVNGESEYALLQTEYQNLQEKYTALEQENEELIKFKNSVEREKKEELINSFYMLSDEDKKEVVENIDNYSLDDIEAKLAVVCVRKKVSFDTEDDKNASDEILTYTVNESHQEVPDFVKALKNARKN